MIFAVASFILIFWTISFFTQNDFGVQTRKSINFKRIMVVYPHPDDEVLTVGGMINRLVRTSTETLLLVCTKGEAGESCVKNITDLKIIRTQEMEKASSRLGFKELIQLDLGDGKLSQKRTELRNALIKVVSDYRPDLVITYDLSGMYGHPDHIALSEEITRLQNRFRFGLWYSVLPNRVSKMVKLPEHMAQDKSFAKKRLLPTHKVFIGSSVFSKIKALYAHKSQYMSFRKAYPFRFIPLWFYVSANMYEYFSEA